MLNQRLGVNQQLGVVLIASLFPFSYQKETKYEKIRCPEPVRWLKYTTSDNHTLLQGINTALLEY